jgi:hypothetical protein
MAGSFEHRAGNAGERPATHTAELPAASLRSVLRAADAAVEPRRITSVGSEFGAQPAAGAGENSRPAPARFVRQGAEAEGGRAQRGYLDTSIGTSSERIYSGSTREWPRIARRRKKVKLIIAVYNSLIECGRNDQAAALIGCGNWYLKKRSPCGTLKLEICPCDSVFCPECANRRSKLLQKEILGKVNRPGKSYWLLGLTVPNTPILTREFMKQLVAHFTELRESSVWKKIPQAESGVDEITGGVYSVETTFNRDTRKWHPHIHCLIEAPRRLPREWIYSVRATWEKITGNAKVVHLERAFGVSKNGKKLHRKLNERGLRELVKYATKCADFSDAPARVDEFLRAFTHLRRVQSFGSFYGAVEAAEREPGCDEEKLVGCSCGKCTARDFRIEFGLVHVSDTRVRPDGSRELKFDYARELVESQDESPPPWELEHEEVEAEWQSRLEFSGVMPELSAPAASLFAA